MDNVTSQDSNVGFATKRLKKRFSCDVISRMCTSTTEKHPNAPIAERNSQIGRSWEITSGIIIISKTINAISVAKRAKAVPF